MYGKSQTEPCPLCTMWIDGYNAAAPHLTQNVDFAVVAAADPLPQRQRGSRGWSNLRLLSAGDSTFKFDLGVRRPTALKPSGSRYSPANDGTVRHLYSKGAQMADDRRERGIDCSARCGTSLTSRQTAVATVISH